MSIAHNLVQHGRTKHIEIDWHFIKEKLDCGLIATTYVPSRSEVADVDKGAVQSGFRISLASWQ